MNRRSAQIWIYFISFLIFAADRVSKYFITHNLPAAKSVSVIPNFFHLTLVTNKGAAFGILKDISGLSIIMTILAIALIILYVYRSRSVTIAVASALGLILGGAMGNLADRVRFGYVIDFLDFRIWPVFNIADSAISAGAAILILSIFSNVKAKSGTSSNIKKQISR
ncbi:MAG: signal peptidase II [Candidatus Omnitrophica bacterium]|nr:signal peptidase II [Candidatus Omnitrophota bacterium]